MRRSSRVERAEGKPTGRQAGRVRVGWALTQAA